MKSECSENKGTMFRFNLNDNKISDSWIVKAQEAISNSCCLRRSIVCVSSLLNTPGLEMITEQSVDLTRWHIAGDKLSELVSD
jgi:hypothetical protein